MQLQWIQLRLMKNLLVSNSYFQENDCHCNCCSAIPSHLQAPAQQWSLHNADAEMRHQHFVMGSATKIKQWFPSLRLAFRELGECFWSREVLIWSLMLHWLCFVNFLSWIPLENTLYEQGVWCGADPPVPLGNTGSVSLQSRLTELCFRFPLQPGLFLGTFCFPAVNILDVLSDALCLVCYLNSG